MPKKYVIAVNKKDAEIVRRFLLKIELLDKGYRPLRRDKLVCFPLIDSSLSFLGQIQVPFALTTVDLEKNPKPPLESLLIGLEDIYGHQPELKIERIGDLALLSVTEDFKLHKQEIITAIKQTYKIKGIFEKISEIKGLYRVPAIRHLSGSRIPLTIHIEYGIKIYVNLEKTYFNPRLANEHNRVASLVSDSEQILDMFTGVGPYSLHIVKKLITMRRNDSEKFKSRVFAIDINPTAIDCLKRSIKLNKLNGMIYPIVADSTFVFHKRIRFDRIIMNLPHAAYQYLLLATSFLKTRGVVHFYTFSREEGPLAVEVAKFNSITKNQFQILSASILRAVAPHKVVVRIDAMKK